jgi:chromosome segregation ATPase
VLLAQFLVWADVRRFLAEPGEVLERVRAQQGSEDDAADLETRRDELAKRLAARRSEKDRYVRAYAQGHISEEELDVYLADLKNQTDNLRLLLGSVEAELSQKREQADLADTTEAWLYALRERIEEVEEDTPEAFQARRRLIKLLVESISADKRPEDGRAEIQITYRSAHRPMKATLRAPLAEKRIRLWALSRTATGRTSRSG